MTTSKGYKALWDESKLTEVGRLVGTAYANKAQKFRNRYDFVARKTGCPWYVIAAIHMREISMKFSGHLHNGEPLEGRTKNLHPKGRPASGNPPFTWEESAVDALTVPPHDMRGVKWSLERTLYELEKYNGLGYARKGRVSPYLWAGTDVYRAGKYVRDGVYDPNHVDKQLGCAALLKALCESDPDVRKRLEAFRDVAPPKEVVVEEKKRAGKTGKVIAGSGGAIGGGSAGTQVPDKPIVDQSYALGAIGIGLGLLTLGLIIFFVMRKNAEKRIEAHWTGQVV